MFTCDEIIMARQRLQLQKYIAAGCELTSTIVLVKLATDRSQKVRRRIAENPRTPITILAMLVSDRSPDVRIGVSDNPATPLGLMLLLSDDSSVDVRYALAENSRSPHQVLCRLTRDENPYVANRAALTLSHERVNDQPLTA